MKKEKVTPKDAELRRRAEERLTGKKIEPDHLPAEEDAMRVVHELQVHQVELELQNEELIRAREELEKQFEKYSGLYNFAPVGYFTLDEHGTILEANLTFAKLLGIDRGRIAGRRFGSFLSDESRPAFDGFLRKACEGTAADPCEVALAGDRDRYLQIEGAAVESGEGRTRQCSVAAMDISRRKRAERRQYLSSEIMEILSDPPSLADAINSIIAAIKREKGFEAVGIRLREGDDFPYFLQNGFSDDFLLTENTLTVRAQDGGICRDRNGNPSLECTCGLVISGRTDPTNPFFTPGGSFWTNNSLRLLDLPAAQDPRLHPRNRCIHEGFHSLAMIPIRANREIVGLLQLIDRKKDRFTHETILFFEGISATIGVALMRKQAEERVREYEKVVESSQDMIAVIDRNYRYLLANKAFLKYRRLNREHVVGRSAPEVLGADVFEGRDKKYLDACFQGKTVNYEMKYSYPDMGERDLFVSYFPVQDSHSVTGAASIIQDVTELRQMEYALRQAHDGLELRVQERTAELATAYEALRVETEQRQSAERQLRQAQKIEALGMLAGGIAHDFNNILAAILGFTELAKDETPEGSPAGRHMERVFSAGVRGRELVKQILAFSRKAEQEKRPLQLATVVEEALKLLRPSLPTTIDIRTNLQSEPGFVLADSTQMQQIVMNLCTNAAHAMRRTGGSISIDLSEYSFSSPKDAPDPTMSPGLYLRLSVSDAGEGMPPDTLERIFDPFFTTKPQGEGTGLGLSVVHGIVASHGGTITVSSELGKGSSFTIYLPKHGEDGARGSAGGDGAIPRGHERVLFIDDEEDIAETGGQMLTRLGYHVISKTNSREALSLFRLNPSDFDVVVTDQTMPELTGVELAKEILALRPDMPIIMCTGFSHLVDAGLARAAGIRAFVLKPLSKREIAQTIRGVLDKES